MQRIYPGLQDFLEQLLSIAVGSSQMSFSISYFLLNEDEYITIRIRGTPFMLGLQHEQMLLKKAADPTKVEKSAHLNHPHTCRRSRKTWWIFAWCRNSSKEVLYQMLKQRLCNDIRWNLRPARDYIIIITIKITRRQ